MATPHNSAEKGDFAKTVLMPGDPLRAKYIADNFLENACLVNNVRGIQGYTGTYKGKPVSVMASGMGMPSMGIYAYELFNFYDVNNIIRVGSTGAINENVNVRDIIIGLGASTTSRFEHQFDLNGTYSAICSYEILKKTMDSVSELGLEEKTHVGGILSSDAFYGETDEMNKKWAAMNVLSIEMEAAALYMYAAQAKKNAIAICTVSDHLLTGESTSSEEREKTFTEMMELALETAIKL